MADQPLNDREAACRGRRAGSFRLVLCVAWSAALLAACAGRTPVRVPHVTESALPPVEVGTYLLREGDEISVRFWGNEELDDEIRIRPDGMISLPFIDEVKAAGRTPAELDATLTELYTGELTNPQITIILREAASERVYIGGEVRGEGVYELRGPVTLVQAIQAAGGFLTSARRREVLLIRTTPEGRVARAVDTLPILDGRDPDADVRLLASDIVFVPRSRITNVDLFVEKYVTGILPIQPVGTVDVFGTRNRNR
jgi:protein involved in polysaccharide export with SLBB domain